MTGAKTPAIFVNLFSIQFTQDGIARIVFSDAVVGKEGNDRVAIAMSIANAEALARSILDVAAQVQAATSTTKQ